jgi:hypothetical protein
MAPGRTIRNTSMLIGIVACIWATASVLSGLAAVNWQVSELLRHYLIAVGLMQEYHTLSDFYTHIKGVEYILAVAFLCAFPAFYSYLGKSPAAKAAAN